MKPSNKVAIVTGAGSGIGKACALRLAQEGAAVAVVDVDVVQAAAVTEAIRRAGGHAVAHTVDVAEEDQVARMVEETHARYGSVDYLLTFAGIARAATVAKITEAEWDEVLDVNLKGTFFCCRTVMPIMKARRAGKIVTISSVTAKRGSTTVGIHYVVSKMGVIALTKSFAQLLAPYGINVNCLSPGPTDTPMNDPLFDTVEKRTQMERLVPLGRFASPEEMADIALFLVSEAAGFITGATIHANGGLYME